MLCLYYLIFTLLAWQIGIPESIAYNLMTVVWKVTLIILVGLPVLLALIWFVALELSHRIVGPLFRVERELDAIVAGEKRGPIKTREKDEFKSLVDKINKLIDKK
jgi:nitrate/nitrite-specific signal transduction histidine kinase